MAGPEMRHLRPGALRARVLWRGAALHPGAGHHALTHLARPEELGQRRGEGHLLAGRHLQGNLISHPLYSFFLALLTTKFFQSC